MRQIVKKICQTIDSISRRLIKCAILVTTRFFSLLKWWKTQSLEKAWLIILSSDATHQRLASHDFFLPTFTASLGKHFLDSDVILKFAYDAN